MTFVNPILAAVGLACVAVPILIHILMRRRRRPIAWAAMRFLLEAYQQQRRRLRFEQWALLAARCLLVALIALALGRPIVGSLLGRGGQGPATLTILIDNGVASQAVDPQTGRPALDRHKDAALALLERLDPAAGDRAALITMGAPARAVVMPASADIAALRQLVRDLSATDSATDLSGAMTLARGSPADAGDAGTRRTVAVLSDFRRGSIDARAGQDAASGTPIGLARVIASAPASQPLGNISIVGVEPTRPVVVLGPGDGGEGSAMAQFPVRVGLRRSGELGSAATRVSLTLQPVRAGGRAIPAGNAVVRWSPGQSEALASISVDASAAGASGGGAAVLVARIDDDALAADNVFRRPIELRSKLRVGLVWTRGAGGTRVGLDQLPAWEWVRLALSAGDGEIEIVDLEPATLDASRLAGLDAAIVARPEALAEDNWRRLRDLASGGGLVVVMPPADQAVHTWTDTMTRMLGLPWIFAREAQAHDPAQSISASRAVTPEADLLLLLSAELPELVRPVRLLRSLAPESGSLEGSTTLLSLASGAPLLVTSPPGAAEQGATGSGLVAYLAAAPSFAWTDLPAKPLMVPMLQELVRQGVGRAQVASAELAGTTPRLPTQVVDLRPLTQFGSGPIRGAASRSEAIERAGVLEALDARGAVRRVIAVNADPSGTRVDLSERQAVAPLLASGLGLAPGTSAEWLERDAAGQLVRAEGVGPSAEARRQDEAGSRIVVALLAAAIVLAVLELAMARWFSHATRAPASGSGAAA